MRSTPEFAYLRPGDTCDTEWRVSERESFRSWRPGADMMRLGARADTGEDWLSWETPSQFSALSLCWHPGHSADRPLHCQTGNLNRPLIVLTRSSWINIVDLVKLPKHQPSLIRPLVRCCGCQPGVMPTQFNRVILWRMGWEEFAP